MSVGQNDTAPGQNEAKAAPSRSETVPEQTVPGQATSPEDAGTPVEQGGIGDATGEAGAGDTLVGSDGSAGSGEHEGAATATTATPASGATTPDTATPDAAGATGEQDDEGGRWTRFAPAPERVPGRAERILRRIGRFCIHEWTLAALGALVLAVIMTWPSALHPASTIPSDIWDPTLQTWQMAWAGHIVFTDPSQLWNGNAFYPDTYSFAFSDTLLGYLPASIIGTGPTAALVRYNMMFILLHGLAFFGAYALVRQVGGARIAGAVAGAAFAYAPWRWGQAGHMHVLSVGGIALSLAMLARGHGFTLTRDHTRPRRAGWAIAGWLVAAWQLTIGFGIGLPFFYALLLLTVIGALVWFFSGRRPLGRRLVIADLAGLLVFGAVGGLLALPYLEVLRLHPEAQRSIEDVKLYSPSLRSFFTAPEQSLFWGSTHAAARASMPYPAETALLVGFTVFGLAIAGLIFSAWSVRARICLAAGVVVSGVLALGTNVAGGRFTYGPLYYHLPGWDSSRTPGRLVIWVTLLLAILAAGAVTALAQRSTDLAKEHIPSRPRPLARLLLLIPLLLVLAEGTNWTSLPHPEVPAQPAAMRTVGAPLLVLPSDPLTDMNIMFWSTTKFQKMVNGNSGFYPTDQTNTREVAKTFPDQASVDYLRQIGIRYVLVVKDRAAGGDYARATITDVPIDGLGISREDLGDTILYTLNG